LSDCCIRVSSILIWGWRELKISWIRGEGDNTKQKRRLNRIWIWICLASPIFFWKIEKGHLWKLYSQLERQTHFLSSCDSSSLWFLCRRYRQVSWVHSDFKRSYPVRLQLYRWFIVCTLFYHLLFCSFRLIAIHWSTQLSAITSHFSLRTIHTATN